MSQRARSDAPLHMSIEAGTITLISPALREDAVIGHDPTKVEESSRSFDDRFTDVFEKNVTRLTRVLDRLSGEPDLAADVVQEAFVRLYRRGTFPDSPEAWLISVALNLFRNARSSERRRERLLSSARSESVRPGPAPRPDEQVVADDTRARVRAAINQLPDRERDLLLLRAEGYSYRDLSVALDIQESSVGTLLARAKERFRHISNGGHDAS